MKSFTTFLNEAFAVVDTSKVSNLIQKYLEKKLATKLLKYPQLEPFKNSVESGFGIRYFFNKKSIRFNWSTSNINSASLSSVDYWNGTSHDPNFHMSFEKNESIVKMLPAVVDFIKNPKIGSYSYIPDDNLNEMYHILEAAIEGDLYDTITDEFKTGEPIPKQWIVKTYFGRGRRVLDALLTKYPHFFETVGSKVNFIASADDLKKVKSSILTGVGAVQVTISKGGQNDKDVTKGDQVDKIEKAGIAKIAYKVQLQHMTSLIKLTVKGASNALFIAGRGGTGKTFTVEKVLKEMGLKDGDGYFKNNGTASAIGMYKLLWKNRTGIIVLDDADAAFADQESRNILKAATDTGKIRKLVWNKDSKGLVDPEDMPDPNDPSGDPSLIPKYFEFTGKVIVISNLQINKLDPDGALRTRGFMIGINPTDAELIDQMEAIVDTVELSDGLTLTHDERMEVIDVIRTGTRGDGLSLRLLVRGLNMKAADAAAGGGSGWQDLVGLYA
jgi:peptidyl-tRNA hydrolase